MAHIANRSRFRVTVKNKPDLTQHFSFSKVAAVEAHMKELRAQGYKPRAEQLDESWLVRIRERGHKPLESTFESEAAATQFIEKTSEERKRGLFIDYTAALKVVPFGGLINLLRRHEPPHGVLGAVACFLDFKNGAVCEVHECPRRGGFRMTYRHWFTSTALGFASFRRLLGSAATTANPVAATVPWPQVSGKAGSCRQTSRASTSPRDHRA